MASRETMKAAIADKFVELFNLDPAPTDPSDIADALAEVILQATDARPLGLASLTIYDNADALTLPSPYAYFTVQTWDLKSEVGEGLANKASGKLSFPGVEEGDYLLFLSVSFSGSPSTRFKGAIFNLDNMLEETVFDQELNASGELEVASVSALIRGVKDTSNLTLRVAHLATGSKSVTITHASMVAFLVNAA